MAKSKLILRINQTLNPFGNNVFTGDWIGITLLNGTGENPTQIHEAPSINRTVKGLYIPKGNTVKGFTQNMISKWISDWGNTGGFQNVKFTYSESTDGNAFRQMEVELQNELWTFGDIVGQAIDNGKVEVISKVNAPAPVPKTFNLEQNNIADCENKNLQYTATITGGTAPYTIEGTALGNISSQTGSQIIQLKRGQDTNITVKDSLGELIGKELLRAPISLDPSYFTIVVSQEELEAQALVSPNVVLPNEVLPITYSLDDSNYQSAGGFSNLQFEQVYAVYIRDKFGCVTSKTFVTPPSIESIEEPEVYARYFKISNAGTLIFNKCENLDENTKRNIYNTPSGLELVGVPHSYTHQFVESDLIVQQFKSSYGFHKITMIADGSNFEILPVLQSENLRQLQKVDAKIFRNIDGALGIYFRRGNTYIENTETVNGTSVYSETNLPSWAKTGAKVKIDDIGTVTIKRIDRDNVVGLYILTNFPYSSLTYDDAKVQGSYNKQPYNTYEFGFFMSQIKKGRIVIEAGFNDLVETTYISENIERIEDDQKRYLVSWSDPYNIAGIVHQTGIKHFARLYMDFHNNTISQSDTLRGDNETFNIDQKAYDVGIMKLAVIGFKMQQKIHAASGMENFAINGINYRKTKLDGERIGDSNLYVLDGEFEFGGNLLEINPDELVLKEPLTGLTNKTFIPDTIPNLLALDNEELISNGSGGFIIIGNED